MTIKSAIRLERAKLRKQEQAAEERLAAVRVKIAALDNAEAALDGETPSTNGDGPAKRTRTFKGRKPFAERVNEALDAIRSKGEEGAVSAADLASGIWIDNGLGPDGDVIRIPHSTAAKAIETLVEDGKVKIVGQTSRGNPVVRYKPTTVRPGEEVKA